MTQSPPKGLTSEYHHLGHEVSTWEFWRDTSVLFIVLNMMEIPCSHHSRFKDTCPSHNSKKKSILKHLMAQIASTSHQDQNDFFFYILKFNAQRPQDGGWGARWHKEERWEERSGPLCGEAGVRLSKTQLLAGWVVRTGLISPARTRGRLYAGPAHKLRGGLREGGPAPIYPACWGPSPALTPSQILKPRVRRACWSPCSPGRVRYGEAPVSWGRGASSFRTARVSGRGRPYSQRDPRKALEVRVCPILKFSAVSLLLTTVNIVNLKFSRRRVFRDSETRGRLVSPGKREC